MSKTTSDSIDSLLLTPKENKCVAQILGKGKKSLATAVAQVYLALPSDRTQWTKMGTGVVCLVKDKQEKSFFIRVLDIKEKCILWEQELYKQFKYRAVSKHFQTFFADDCRAGINFSSTEEAALFRAAIMERVNVFKKKREEMRQRKLAYQQQQKMNYQMSQLAMQNPYFRMPFAVPQNVDYRMRNMMLMQMRSPAVATSQRAQLQAMFNSMTPETKQAFFLSLNGGPSMMGQPGMSPDKNQSNFSLQSSPSQIPTMTPALPQDQPPTSKTATDSATMILPPEPAGEPGPPPPPPPANAPPPPTPPTFTPPVPRAAAKAEHPPPSSNRGGLLESIQAGKKLRKVDESTSRKKIPKVESGMRGALTRALDNRAKVLGDEDSDDEEEEWDDDDDDDWSD